MGSAAGFVVVVVVVCRVVDVSCGGTGGHVETEQRGGVFVFPAAWAYSRPTNVIH